MSPLSRLVTQRRAPLAWGAWCIEKVLSLSGWRQRILVVPRGDVHWMQLDVKGVPARFVASSLKLRLQQLLGDAHIGFAFRAKAGTAVLWYWRESGDSRFAQLLASLEVRRNESVTPWPEPLLRMPIEADGAHLFRCQEGVEAVWVEAGEVRRTRWFSASPTQDAWVAFVRDAGGDPEACPQPPVLAPEQENRVPAGWRLSTRLSPEISPLVWGASLAIALAGLVLVIGCVYDVKLSRALAVEQRAYDELSKENAITIALQKEIDQKSLYLEKFAGLQSAQSQISLMAILANSGLLSEESGVSLSEWEFHNDRLRLLFSVPGEGFKLGRFLAVLEDLPVLDEIKLMPDTPRGTVGVQASLLSVAEEQRPVMRPQAEMLLAP